jgi:diaminopimelate decarboxylase
MDQSIPWGDRFSEGEVKAPPTEILRLEDLGLPKTDKVTTHGQLADLKDVLPVTAEVNELGHLTIGGCDTVDLALNFGTPLFVFCEQTFRAQTRAFKSAFQEATIYYAAKAFLSRAMCRLVDQEGLFMDVASGGELHVALSANFPPERLILHGNNKLDSEIATAVEAGVGRIAIDNLEEVERVADAAMKAGVQQAVVLRVTPGVRPDTHRHIQTGHQSSKFGLDMLSGAALESARRVHLSGSLILAGIHAHIGSNIFSFEPFTRTIEVLFDLASEIRSGLRLEIGEINLGGGFGIPYVAGDQRINLDMMADLLGASIRASAHNHAMEPPRVCLEPGRFLIGNAMVTLYTAGVIKRTSTVHAYVSVDGGMSDNIRPALYQADYDAVVANKATEPRTHSVTLAGMHCESGDVLATHVTVPASVERGDIIAVPATGAYGYSMASNYNKKPRPAVVTVSGGNARLMVRAETFDDLTRLDEPL